MSKSCALPKSVFPLKFEVHSPSHALELARQLIRPYRHWMVGDFAGEGKNGVEGGVDVKSPRAEAFCALGALQRVNTKHQKKAKEFLIQAANWALGEDLNYSTKESVIFSLNDDAESRDGHARVLKMFAKAIRLAKKAEKAEVTEKHSFNGGYG